MFAYDKAIRDAASAEPRTIDDVLRTMRVIEAACTDGDGLKWFNWLYLRVTEAVARRVAIGGFRDPPWLAELDVQFARLYFAAIVGAVSHASIPGSWRVLLARRRETQLARIQFALAGINAHINHDLPIAIVATWRSRGAGPRAGDDHHLDYTALNATLAGLVDSAKRELHVRLLGDALPAVSHVEDVIAAWSVEAAREAAWTNAEVLWSLESAPFLSDLLSSRYLNSLDGLTSVAGKALMIPVPNLA